MKRGLETSEAKLAILTALGQLLAALAGVVPATWSVGGISVVVVAYTIARGLAKLGGGEARGEVATPTAQLASELGSILPALLSRASSQSPPATTSAHGVGTPAAPTQLDPPAQ